MSRLSDHHPDFDAFQRVMDDVEEARRSGAWTRERYEEFRARALTALDGFNEPMEALRMLADPSWLAPITEKTRALE